MSDATLPRGVGGAALAEPQEMTLRDYLTVIRRRKWFVIVPALLSTALATGLSLSQTERYRASTDVLVKRPPSAINVGAPEQALTLREVQNELLRARGSAIQDTAQAQVGSEPELSVSLANSDDADVLVFTAESRDPERAANAADIYASSYIAERRQALTSDFQARAEVVQSRVTDLASQLAQFPPNSVDEAFVELVTQKAQYESELESLFTSIRLAETSGATVIDAAQVPQTPFEPTPVRSAVLALVVGLLIGLGAAFLVDYLDRSVRDEEDLAAATRLPVLAVIPKLKGWKPSDTHIVTRENPTSPPAEAYRALRTSLQFLRLDRTLDVVQVTSPKPGDGKTTTSTNIAVVCARAGQRGALYHAPGLELEALRLKDDLAWHLLDVATSDQLPELDTVREFDLVLVLGGDHGDGMPAAPDE